MPKLAKAKEADEASVEEGQEQAVSSVLATAEESTNSDTAATETSDETESTDEIAGENPETAPPENGIVVEEPVYAVPAKEKTVKVALACDHSCFIGGVSYHFRKGETVSVPEPVKDILKNAGLLAAL